MTKQDRSAAAPLFPMPRRLGTIIAFTVVLATQACGGTSPSPVSAVPSPTPTATPAPTPSPSPTPPSSPIPPPIVIGPGSSCRLGSSSATRCAAATVAFRSWVELALSDLRRTRPDLFGAGSVIKDQDKYLQEMANRLRAMGFCVQTSDDGVGLKTSNTGSERWDLILSSGEPWAGYISTCWPAHF